MKVSVSKMAQTCILKSCLWNRGTCPRSHQCYQLASMWHFQGSLNH